MSRLLVALVFTAVWLPAAEPTADEIAADECLLKLVGVALDDNALLDFFRKRTLSDTDRAAVDLLIKQLGSESFDAREEASKKLPAYGTTILPALRAAAQVDDAELARRAREAMARIEAEAVSDLPGAAARTLARKKPAGATPVLLAYLPFADDLGVEEEILAALLALNPKNGAADAALAPALRAAHPVIRAAAAHVLGRRGDDAVRKLLADKDARVRFRAVVALISSGDRAAVPSLIDLLGEDLGLLSWQVEDALFRLAGEQAPPPAVGVGGDGTKMKARDAWRAWWKDHGDKVDLARFDIGERLIGLTLGIEYNTGRIWECGPDGKTRWEIKNLMGPMEAQVLPGGRVLIAESNNKTISERDFQGKVLWQKVLPNEPTGVQRLPNGNTFVSCFGRVLEFDRDGKTVFEFDLPGGGSNGIRKARNGNVIFTHDTEIVEVDAAGKKVRSIPLQKQGMWVGLRDLPGDRFLLCNSTSGRVLEIDAAGKTLWEPKDPVPGACGIAKLPNGHVLVGTSNRVIELDRAGKHVWELACPGYVRRIHRR